MIFWWPLVVKVHAEPRKYIGRRDSAHSINGGKLLNGNGKTKRASPYVLPVAIELPVSISLPLSS
jgi:hypothetical protein